MSLNYNYQVKVADKSYSITFPREGSFNKINVNGVDIPVKIDSKNLLLSFIEDKKVVVDNFVYEGQKLKEISVDNILHGVEIELGRPEKFVQKVGASKSAAVKNILAPMPGKITEVKVKENDEVKKGDLLFIIEAMKMENHIYSTVEGTIKQVSARAGVLCKSNEKLIVFK